MLTRKVSYCKVCSSASAGEGSLGISPTLGLFCSLNSSPCSPAPLGKVLWLQSLFIFPQHRNQLLGPKENKSTEKMWKVPVLLLVLGSAWLWDPAEGASTVRPEDDVTPGVEDSVVTLGAEDNVMTTGTSEEPYESGLTALVPINTESVTDFHLEDGPTQESTVHAREESQSTTALNVVTHHSVDGLATVTLVGIIVGVLLAIGFIGGIIIVVARKMSGRYSP
ncbi:podoplanin isoform X3 [Zalophus californianus]|uniref:Podoplanin isoform X3 n=1 Tax=Zalophus californianus TaxID=9704 RepID=A0A6J2BQQ2_ZALCA|nr:podoplanin isoform X3 [Zalophus californianus]